MSRAICNFSRKEEHVLKSFNGNERCRAQEISRRARLPRSTTDTVLLSLENRGLIGRVQVQNHTEWQLITHTELENVFQSATSDMQALLYSSNGILHPNASVHQGEGVIGRLYERFKRLRKGDRLLVIQGNLAPENMLKRVDQQTLFEAHNRVKKHGIVIECINGRDGLVSFFQTASLSELESHFGRPVITYIVDDRYILFDADIFILKEMLFIFHYEREVVIEINNKTICSAFLGIFSFLKDYAQKVDLNAFIREELDRRERAGQL